MLLQSDLQTVPSNSCCYTTDTEMEKLNLLVTNATAMPFESFLDITITAQAQLQHLPHFISNGQLHQHQHQNQLIWQAQMARFRPNGMHHSSSSSSSTLPSNHQQPSIFSFIPNFNQQLHQQFVPLPPHSLSSRLSNAESYR